MVVVEAVVVVVVVDNDISLLLFIWMVLLCSKKYHGAYILIHGKKKYDHSVQEVHSSVNALLRKLYNYYACTLTGVSDKYGR